MAFTSTATNLVANDTNGLLTDVFLRDLATGATTLVSVNNAGTGSGNLASTNAAISAGGGTVAFTSTASDLVPNDTNGLLTDIFAAQLGGQLQIVPPAPISEGDGPATITVVRTGGSVGTVTVDFATSDGTATAGADYLASLGTITFAPGETSQTFIVPILPDTLDEPDETVNLSLANPTGGATLAAPPHERAHDRGRRPRPVDLDRGRERAGHRRGDRRGGRGDHERRVHRHALGPERPDGDGRLRHRAGLGDLGRRLLAGGGYAHLPAGGRPRRRSSCRSSATRSTRRTRRRW